MSEIEKNKLEIEKRKTEDLIYLGDVYNKIKGIQNVKLSFGKYVNLSFKDNKITIKEPPRYNKASPKDIACIRVVNKEILLTSCYFPKQIKKFPTSTLLEKELMDILKQMR